MAREVASCREVTYTLPLPWPGGETEARGALQGPSVLSCFPQVSHLLSQASGWVGPTPAHPTRGLPWLLQGQGRTNPSSQPCPPQADRTGTAASPARTLSMAVSHGPSHHVSTLSPSSEPQQSTVQCPRHPPMGEGTGGRTRGLCLNNFCTRVRALLVTSVPQQGDW